MRILVVTNLFPNAAQPQRAMFNLHQFTALALHHRVHVIAPVAWTSGARALRPIPALGHERSEPSSASHLSVTHVPYFYTPRSFRGRYGHLMAASIRASFHAAVRSLAPDIVLGCWAYPDGWAAASLAREADLPVVLKVHGSDLMLIDPNRLHAGRPRQTCEALRMADGVIAVGHHLRDRAITLGVDARRAWVVRNGVDTSVFSPADKSAARRAIGYDEASPLILSVGNLAPVKGHDILIRALASLPHRNWRCVIIGHGPQQRRLLRCIASAGLQGIVRIVPPCTQQELAQWYRAADLLVLPSRSEGVPNVAMEAAACRLPVIASDVGGVADVVAAEGLVPPGDTSALTARLEAWLDHPPALADPPKTRSWADSASELIDVLSTVALSHGQRRAAA
jgi:glycosyltransferase involved in cell wall biosynthesis